MKHRHLLLPCLLGLLTACHRSTPPPPAAMSAPETERPLSTLRLTTADIVHLGVVIEPATAAWYSHETEGVGVVVGRDVIAQPLTEIVTARAAMRQSHAAEARMRRLAGTPGADSELAWETAGRQTVADDASLALAEAKAASVLGDRSPWNGAGGLATLHDLASGRITVLRITFPLGSFTTGMPQQLHVSRLDGRGDESRWRVTTRWPAPADPSIPGLTYFAIVARSDLAEGERLVAQATDARSPAEPGVFIPASAVVIAADHYWAYRRDQDGSFSRMAVDIGRPRPGGYVVTDGIKPGEAIVTSGAGLLLARETTPAHDADP